MADPLSISAAVVGFAAFALEVAKTVTGFVQDAKGFPEEFQSLSLVANEFGVVVRRLTPVFERLEAENCDEGEFSSVNCES